jgi:three-Cys-motif partner protein
MGKDFNPIQLVENDGLTLMEVGNWAQKKYKLVGKYCDIFTTGMRNKWNLIYVDLFCGPGYVKNKQSGAIMKNSALIAMSLTHKFDFYALNDMDHNNCLAIEKRINRLYPSIPYEVFNYNANNHAEHLISKLPQFDNGKPDLFFCFIDPFSLDLNFETIKTFAAYQSDFLILHALQMDARRNFAHYLKLENDRVDCFLGNYNWREDFKAGGYQHKDSIKFISDEYDNSMRKLNYQPSKKEKINNSQGNGIYYLAFYSKHPRGIDFFEKIRKGDNDQLELF